MKISFSKIGLYLTVISSAALVACGNSSSNPLDKYAGIKLEPKNEVKAQTANILPDLFFLADASGKSLGFPHFTEGQTSEVLIKAGLKDPSVLGYTIELVDFSNLERPVLTATSTKGVYSLKWNPAVGTIANGQSSQSFDAKLQIVVTEASNQNLIGGASIEDLVVFVDRTSQQPKLTKINGLSKDTVVNEGVATEFSIDVTDLSNAPKLPDVILSSYRYSNTEAYRADVLPFIYVDDRIDVHASNPEKVGGVYRFYYVMLINKLPLDRDRQGHEIPVATSVDICFLVQVKSGVDVLSGQSQICAKAKYAVQPPTVNLVDASGQSLPEGTLDVKPMVETVLTVKFSTEHPLSVVTVTKPDLLIASLSGQKSIVCSADAADKKNSGSCIIKWTPACVSKTATFNLAVKVDGTLDKTTKSTSISKTITVSPDLAACPVKGGK